MGSLLTLLDDNENAMVKKVVLDKSQVDGECHPYLSECKEDKQNKRLGKLYCVSLPSPECAWNE